MTAFDYCVVGNGLLGASAAELLAARGAAVCLIGAQYGAKGEFYSSHEDSSRIFRTWHDSAYWQTLAHANLASIRALEESTHVPIFDAAPVYFDRGAAALLPVRNLTQYLDTHGLSHEDPSGGVINPKSYIDALNRAAQAKGAVVHRGIVARIAPEGGAFRIDWSGGRTFGRKVIDVRGIHTPGHAELKVQGKVVFLVKHAASAHKHCFVKRNNMARAFSDAYGCVEYSQIDGWAMSKVGFSEATPLYLENADAVRAWFQKDYVCYPHRTEALALIDGLGWKEIQHIDIQPCAFTVTRDGKPLIEQHDGYLRLSGCNGMVAKCCQALMASVIEERSV